MKARNLNVKYTFAVVLALVAGLAAAVPTFGHVEPIKQRDLLKVTVTLESFMPLYDHEGWFLTLRGAHGEFQARSVFFVEDGHAPTRDVRSPLVEDINGRDKVVLNPAPVLYQHKQCHPLGTFDGKIEIWEDDSDGELLAAVRAGMKEMARFATGDISGIAKDLVGLILEITGLETIVGEWVKGLTETLKKELEGIAGKLGVTVIEAAAKLAVNAALGEFYDNLDQSLAELVMRDEINQQINQLAKNLKLPGEVRNIARNQGHSLLDQGIDFAIDLLAGSGDDLVGVYEGPFQFFALWELSTGQNSPAQFKTEKKTMEVKTTNFNDAEDEGAYLTFLLTIKNRGPDEECNSRPVAVAEIERIGGELAYGIERKEAEVVVGTEVQLTSRLSSDSDMRDPQLEERLTYTWGFVKLEGRPEGTSVYLSTDLRGSYRTAKFVPDVPGEYVVKLTVTDSAGAPSKNESTVTVRAVLPTRELTPAPVETPAPLQEKASGKTETAGGLHTATFETPQGKIKVNLPDDMAAGDTISGTVSAEPAGKDSAERQRNGDELVGYVVAVGDVETSVGKDIQWNIPTTDTSAPLMLMDRNRVVISSRLELPVKTLPETAATQALPTPENYSLPRLGQPGKPIQIPGRFDGKFSSTAVIVGGEPTVLLAESPRRLVFESPVDTIGPTIMEFKEGDIELTGEFRNVDVQLSAPKLDLNRGESTTLTIEVSGLEGLDMEIPLTLNNNSPSVIKMQDGDIQAFRIAPEDVQENGGYRKTLRLTGIRPGGFNIQALLVLGCFTAWDDYKEALAEAGQGELDFPKYVKKFEDCGKTKNRRALRSAAKKKSNSDMLKAIVDLSIQMEQSEHLRVAGLQGDVRTAQATEKKLCRDHEKNLSQQTQRLADIKIGGKLRMHYGEVQSARERVDDTRRRLRGASEDSKPSLQQELEKLNRQLEAKRESLQQAAETLARQVPAFRNLESKIQKCDAQKTVLQEVRQRFETAEKALQNELERVLSLLSPEGQDLVVATLTKKGRSQKESAWKTAQKHKDARSREQKIINKIVAAAKKFDLDIKKLPAGGG